MDSGPHDYSFSDFLELPSGLSAWTRIGVAGVMLESYQGGGASFAPVEFIQSLREWCDSHQIQLIFDEVQAGFGRTGRYFAFEHYGVAARSDLLRERHVGIIADFGGDR